MADVLFQGVELSYGRQQIYHGSELCLAERARSARCMARRARGSRACCFWRPVICCQAVERCKSTGRNRRKGGSDWGRYRISRRCLTR